MAGNSYRKADAPLSLWCLFALLRRWETAGWMVKEEVAVWRLSGGVHTVLNVLRLFCGGRLSCWCEAVDFP